MYIENEIKLDFKDVLIRPKRSNLTSRSEVDVEREFTFKHSSYKWKGVPIMVANMDTTGTFEMAEAVSKHKIFTCIHKYYSLDDWIHFSNHYNKDILNYIAVSSGSREEDLEKLQSILVIIPEINFICLDVANGYTEHFVSFIMRVRLLYPDKVIIAGSVVTREMTEELLLKGYKTAVFHGMNSHEFNLTSKYEVRRYLSSLVMKEHNNKHNTTSKPYKIKSKNATASGILFNNTPLIILTLSPKGSDDIPEIVEEKVREISEDLGFKDIILIDSHNSEGDIVDEEDVDELINTTRELLNKLKNC